jgi:type I restriction enzyme S subunit
MGGYRLMVPPVSLRSMFFEVVSDILRQQAILSAQTSKLAESRDLLLPRLMNGEIAV